MRQSKGGRTADELLAELEADPEWVAVRDAKYATAKAIEDRDIAEQGMLLADLRRLGYRVKWIWDFVNSADRYDDAIPILINHLRRPYSESTRQGLARALSIREARGLAGSAMIDVLKEGGLGRDLRWALANALTVVADRSNQNDIRALLAAETNKDIANRLARALKKAAKP